MTRTLSLDQKLAGISIMIRSKPALMIEIAKVDIESTLAEEFVALLDKSNLRLLSPAPFETLRLLARRPRTHSRTSIYTR